jgi:hypothetical protein
MSELINLTPTHSHTLNAPRKKRSHPISPARIVSSGASDDMFKDYYPTPQLATRTFLAAIRRDFPHLFTGIVWEPACGQLHMAKEIALLPEVQMVLASDTEVRPAIPSLAHPKIFQPYQEDFLNPTNENTRTMLDSGRLNTIITNPPFRLCQQFIQQALSLPATGGVIMFTRLNFIASKRRADPLKPDALLTATPPNAVYVYAGRLTLWSALSERPKDANAGTVDYCVSVWDHSNRQRPHEEGGQTLLKFLHVPPGSASEDIDPEDYAVGEDEGNTE